ncbi:MAG TPA: SIMPL domain-containing protein [Ruminococcus sp.]|nr:SIMPL domain-containing protein [Ruminococcus sp.]
MSGRISVKGEGKVSLSPDQIIIDLTLQAKDMDYSRAAELAEKQISSLKKALSRTGFSSDDLRTAAFNVRTEYEGTHDENGVYRNVFSGYICIHQLRLSFPMDTDRLGETLSAVSSSDTQPELNVSFTLSDTEAAKDELLRSAAENARKKADILASASGASLGKLVEIRYNVNEPDFVSPTSYEMNDCLRACGTGFSKAISFRPENISVSDTAVFIWELI